MSTQNENPYPDTIPRWIAKKNAFYGFPIAEQRFTEWASQECDGTEIRLEGAMTCLTSATRLRPDDLTFDAVQALYKGRKVVLPFLVLASSVPTDNRPYPPSHIHKEHLELIMKVLGYTSGPFWYAEA